MPTPFSDDPKPDEFDEFLEWTEEEEEAFLEIVKKQKQENDE